MLRGVRTAVLVGLLLVLLAVFVTLVASVPAGSDSVGVNPTLTPSS